jgi:D-alanine-D-alanine ligase-like ATP-grasp enzyme
VLKSGKLVERAKKTSRAEVRRASSEAVFENEAASQETTCGTAVRKDCQTQVKEVSEIIPLSPGWWDLDSKYTLESLILAQNERWRRA